MENAQLVTTPPNVTKITEKKRKIAQQETIIMNGSDKSLSIRCGIGLNSL